MSSWDSPQYDQSAPQYGLILYWNTVGNSIIALCNKSFQEEKIPEKINETYICLISKIKGAKSLKEFRLISLCNTTYKIITKIIAQWLRPYMDKLIGPCQSSFLKKRQATDNVIIILGNNHSLLKKCQYDYQNRLGKSF